MACSTSYETSTASFMYPAHGSQDTTGWTEGDGVTNNLTPGYEEIKDPPEELILPKEEPPEPTDEILPAFRRPSAGRPAQHDYG